MRQIAEGRPGTFAVPASQLAGCFLPFFCDSRAMCSQEVSAWPQLPASSVGWGDMGFLCPA